MSKRKRKSKKHLWVLLFCMALMLASGVVVKASYDNPPSSLVQGPDFGSITSTGTATFYLSDGTTSYKYVISGLEGYAYGDPWGSSEAPSAAKATLSWTGPTLVRSGPSGATFEAPRILNAKIYVSGSDAWVMRYYNSQTGQSICDPITHPEYKEWGTMDDVHLHYGLSVELENTIRLSTGYKLASTMDERKYGTQDENPVKYNHSYDKDGAYWHWHDGEQGVVVSKDECQKETPSTSFNQLVGCWIEATRYIEGKTEDEGSPYTDKIENVFIPYGANSFDAISNGTGNSIVINGSLQEFSGTTWIFSETRQKYIAQETDEIEYIFKTVPKNYSATFNANGGALNDYISGGGSGRTTATARMEWGANYYDNVGGLNPNRQGYAFTGWYTSSGEKIWDENGQAVKGSSCWTSDGKWRYDGDITVYAKWEQSTTWVVFDANWGELYNYIDDGSGTLNQWTNVTSAYLEYGRDYYDDISRFAPRREGFTFQGWFTDPDNTENGRDNGTQVWTKDGYALDGTTYNGENFWVWENGDHAWKNRRDAITVFAHWHKDGDPYTLKIDPNGGTWNGSTSVQTFSLNPGGTKPIPAPTHSNYSFAGWRVSTDNSTWTGTTWTMPSNDVTLTAQWTYNPSYTLTIDPNGGTWDGSTSVQAFLMKQGDTKSIAAATRAGYTFAGWKRSTDGGTWTGTLFTMGSQNTTLTAQWTRNESTLKVNPNGGVWNNSSSVQSFTKKSYETMLIPVPTRPGYTFTTWSKSNPFYGSMSTLTGSATYTFGAENAVTSTITASWRANEYNVTFNVNDNYTETGKYALHSASCSPTTKKVTFEQKYGTLPTPTRSGYTFLGWYTAASGGSQVTADTIYTTVGDTTLYAHWRNEEPNSVVLKATASSTNSGARSYSVSGTGNTAVWSDAAYSIKVAGKDNGDGIASVTVTSFAEKSINREEDMDVSIGTYSKEGTSTLIATVKDYEGNRSGRIYDGIVRTANLTLKIDRSPAKVTGFDVILGTNREPLDTATNKSWHGKDIYKAAAYGAKIDITASDRNSLLVNEADVSGIKHMWLRIYDTHNPSVYKDYTLIANGASLLDASYSGVIDINNDFNNIMDLTYELHITDNAGNTTVDERRTERKPEIYTKVVRTTEAPELELDDNEFLNGYRGQLLIYTVGWVDRVELEWPEEIIKASEYDAANGREWMDYNITIDMTDRSQETLYYFDVDGENTEFTRCYVFDFWIPLYLTDEQNPDYIDLPEEGGVELEIDSVAVKDVAGTPVMDDSTVPIKIGNGSILKRIRSSLLK